MTLRADASLADVARAVCTALENVGVVAVLTGGSAATYYAPDAYQSSDIAFVAVSFRVSDPGDVTRALGELGYELRRDHYRHPVVPYPIEFPPGPLAVGGELVRTWRTDRSAAGTLHVISATDCCKDRLAAFFHWGDRSGLDQALAVYGAIGNEIDLEDLRRWAEREGAAEPLREFERRTRPRVP